MRRAQTCARSIVGGPRGGGNSDKLFLGVDRGVALETRSQEHSELRAEMGAEDDRKLASPSARPTCEQGSACALGTWRPQLTSVALLHNGRLLTNLCR